MVNELIERLTWLGHDSYRVDGDLVIYFDPYEINEGAAADIILISHEHFDHCSPGDVAKIQNDETVIVSDKASATKLKGEVKTMEPGDRLSVKGVEVEAVPAYNLNKQFHPKSAGMLGFVVNIGGVRLYHAGDTDFIPEMNEIETDIALLPVSGTYVMTAAEAVEAALAIKPKVAIPMHYGAIVGDKSDAEHFRDRLAGKMEVVILAQE
jgi:L-ascorbate metabolism protein UlaG (beta-lactamase superfamily)